MVTEREQAAGFPVAASRMSGVDSLRADRSVVARIACCSRLTPIQRMKRRAAKAKFPYARVSVTTTSGREMSESPTSAAPGRVTNSPPRWARRSSTGASATRCGCGINCREARAEELATRRVRETFTERCPVCFTEGSNLPSEDRQDRSGKCRFTPPAVAAPALSGCSDRCTPSSARLLSRCSSGAARSPDRRASRRG